MSNKRRNVRKSMTSATISSRQQGRAHGNGNGNDKKNKSVNKVRIIGGRFKSRQIGFIDADGLRPTPDRVRETIFNWLMPYLFEATVLDACAGSGAFGFEALSRGASHCTFIEANHLQSQCIQNTAQQLGLIEESMKGRSTSTACLTPLTTPSQTIPSQTAVQIVCGEAQNLIPSLDTVFDLVFIDPPYALNLWHPILSALLDADKLKSNALVYLESPLPLEALALPTSILCHFEQLKQKKMGGVYGHLLRLQNNGSFMNA